MINRPQPSFAELKNELLKSLLLPERQKFFSGLEPVSLDVRTVLHRPDEMIEHVYFIDSGMVSMIAVLADGAESEVGLAGCEGFVGIPLVLGTSFANLESVVQVPGRARRIAAGTFKQALEEVPHFNAVLLQYVNVFHLQVAQTAVCNKHHQLEQRLARWLLMTADRVEAAQFPMTQEFLSRMLGVQRPTINLAMQVLNHTNVTKQKKGWIEIADRSRLERISCTCYSQVRSYYLDLLQNRERV